MHATQKPVNLFYIMTGTMNHISLHFSLGSNVARTHEWRDLYKLFQVSLHHQHKIMSIVAELKFNLFFCYKMLVGSTC